MKTMVEFTAKNQMLFFTLYSTIFQWISFHSWINSLLYVTLNSLENSHFNEYCVVLICQCQ